MESQHGSWMETIKSKLAAYPDYVVDIVIYVPVGLVLGLLFKNFGRYIVLGALVLGLGFWLSSHFNFITLHRETIQSFVGPCSINSAQEFFGCIYSWIEAHVAAVIAATIGFVIGWKLA